MRTLRFLFLSLFVFSSFALAAPLEKPFDHSTWDSFLKKYVNEKGEVNFTEVKKDPSLLNQYLNELRQANEVDFADWPREEVIAFWINAYHSGIIAVITSHYPVKSVQEVPSIWETKHVRLESGSYSLNEIRTQQLLGTFKDEKIHFALSCLSKDCPVLSRDAYTGPKLDGQLFMAVRRFVNDDTKIGIKAGDKKIYVSKLFKWYGKDFGFNFGKPENEEGLSKEEFAFLSFLSFYIEDANKVDYLEEKRYKIKYPKFDWSLNDWRP